MSGKVGKLLVDLIVVSFNFSAMCCTVIPMLSIMCRSLIFGNYDIGVYTFSFADYALEEVLILSLIVTRAPLMKVTIDAMFNLDMH